jgi:isoaspartyl peptidase/L-asparaginase-like protein (Ntn-hydrolase superfamily)
MNRRNFITKTTIAASGVVAASSLFQKKAMSETLPASVVSGTAIRPIAISTWVHGLEANRVAMEMMQQGSRALDAVEAGVKTAEADPENQSVGIGGRPDRDGHVTLDASIIDEHGNCGAVAYLQHIVHPVSVARLVMEKTPHVMLVGDGALQFALENGFQKTDLLTAKSRKEWEEWKKESKYHPVPNIENLDTIGQIVIDAAGNLSGACTTSGMGFKMNGRVGDSPIIGAGLYVDNEVGGATATGIGELVIRTVGSFLVVELMRNGRTPQQACEEAVMRIANSKIDLTDAQVGFVAVNKNGETGGYSLRPGFDYALAIGDENKMIPSESYFK